MVILNVVHAAETRNFHSLYGVAALVVDRGIRLADLPTKKLIQTIRYTKGFSIVLETVKRLPEPRPETDTGKE